MVTNLDGLQRAIDIQSELSFLKGRIDIKSHADLRIVLEGGQARQLAQVNSQNSCIAKSNITAQ